MPATPRFVLLRQKMVDDQLRGRGIQDERVLAAMHSIPRHVFVDEALWDRAYGDYPLPIGHGQTISQPYTVARMTELLELTGDEKVLEIGTGCGYQTAVLAECARIVYSIERLAPLTEKARETLKALKYHNTVLRVDDGTRGWPAEAPFDGVIVAAAAPHAPETLKHQLADGGRLVIPVGSKFEQTLMVIKRVGGVFTEIEAGGYRFVELVGEHGW